MKKEVTPAAVKMDETSLSGGRMITEMTKGTEGTVLTRSKRRTTRIRRSGIKMSTMRTTATVP